MCTSKMHPLLRGWYLRLILCMYMSCDPPKFSEP